MTINTEARATSLQCGWYLHGLRFQVSLFLSMILIYFSSLIVLIWSVPNLNKAQGCSALQHHLTLWDWVGLLNTLCLLLFEWYCSFLMQSKFAGHGISLFKLLKGWILCEYLYALWLAVGILSYPFLPGTGSKLHLLTVYWIKGRSDWMMNGWYILPPKGKTQ